MDDFKEIVKRQEILSFLGHITKVVESFFEGDHDCAYTPRLASFLLRNNHRNKAQNRVGRRRGQ